MSDQDPSRFAPPGQAANVPPVGPPPAAGPPSPAPAPSGAPRDPDRAGPTPVLSDLSAFAPPVGEPTEAAPSPHARPRRGLGSWAAVVLVALLVGLVGGYAGAALHGDDEPAGDEPTPAAPAPQDPGRVDPAPLPVDNDDVAKVADTLLPSTVQIFAEVDGVDDAATGSGFVLDDQGHVVTNNHVIEHSARDNGPITVVDHQGTEHDATVVGRSQTYDLAVLQVDRQAGLQPAALGDSDELRVGEGLVALGSPLGLTSTVTWGIVSALHRPVTTGETGNSASYIDAVQTDAAINPGNSGGPLVNLAGQVIGVNSAIATSGGEGGNIGVGFAIPVNQMKITVAQLIEDGFATYPVMGADVDTTPGTSGARIESVQNGSPAADAGVRPGDRVIRLDGTKVTDGVSLIVTIRSHQPGDRLELTLVRAGEQRKVTVTLEGQREQ